MDIPESTIISVLQTMSNGAAVETGIKPLLAKAKAQYGGEIPAFMEAAVMKLLPATFGGYPNSTDKAPSAVFLALYVILFLAHSAVFTINYSRGHRFIHSFLIALYCLFNFIGYTLRIPWANDNTKIDIGLTSSVMLYTSTVALAGVNVSLASRVYQWRHPVFTSGPLYRGVMYFIYVLVGGTIIMGIVSSVIPYLYFLGEDHYNMCKKVARATGLLSVLYSALSSALLVLSLVHPVKQSDNILVYQPYWIKSFSPFYFVEKNASKIANGKYIAHHKEKHGITYRVIAASNQHHTTVEDIVDDANLKHNKSYFVISMTTLLLLISTCFRCASLFIDKRVSNKTFIFNNTVSYCTHGLLEFLAILLYLVFRVDLRFYKPDSLKLTKMLDSKFIPSISSAEDGISSNEAAKTVDTASVSNEKPADAVSNEVPAEQ